MSRLGLCFENNTLLIIARDESGPPTLVVHGNTTSAIWASSRDLKEIKEDLVDWACCDLRDAGYTGVRITLKSDGGKA